MISRGCFEFWFGNQDNLTIGNILSNIFLFHGVSPYWVNGIIPGGWSIAVEMNYYLLFPIIFTYINTIRKASYFTTASLIVYTILHLIMKHIVFVGYSQYYTDYLFYWFPAQLPIFSFGILLYLIYKNKVLNHNNYGSIKAGMMYIIAGIFLIVTLILYYKVHVYGIGVPQHIIYGIAFSFIILGTFYYPIILMVNGFTIYMGKISYSCYILHFPVIYLMSNYKVIDIINGISINIFGNLYKYITFITVSSIIILITLIIASITYKLIEKPLIIFGKRVIRYIIGRKLSRVSILYNQ
jgi:peptidoglycan/LPS O-acetylase OafA/YrhL